MTDILSPRDVEQKLDSYALCAAYDIEKECSALLDRSSP